MAAAFFDTRAKIGRPAEAAATAVLLAYIRHAQIDTAAAAAAAAAVAAAVAVCTL